MKATALILSLLALAVPGAILAQNYPVKPIRIVVPYTPGGGADIAARLLAPKLFEALGQQVIVDNRPGANTNIGNEYVAKASPDGYTLLLTSPNVAVNMSLYKKLAFDTLRDFAAISVFSASPNILVVNASLPVKSVKDFIALARARPGQLNFSSSGSGSTQHLSGELFKLKVGVDMTHIPFKGTAPSLTALMSGEVDMSFSSIPAVYQHVKSGRLRPLASTGPKRAELMPEVPTMKESGVDMEVVVWYAVLAPSATPREIINKLAESIIRIVHSPDIKQRLLDLGGEPVGSTPEQFSRQLRAEVATWAEVVKASGATAD